MIRSTARKPLSILGRLYVRGSFSVSAGVGTAVATFTNQGPVAAPIVDLYQRWLKELSAGDVTASELFWGSPRLYAEMFEAVASGWEGVPGLEDASRNMKGFAYIIREMGEGVDVDLDDIPEFSLVEEFFDDAYPTIR
jgi:hypothetical protein